MTPQQLKRAKLLYRRYQTHSREYHDIANSLGLNTGELNQRMWHVMAAERDKKKTR